MKFGQLIEYNMGNVFFFQKPCRKWGRESSSKPLYVFKKALYAFASWGIGQYVYCTCFLSRLWTNKFWNYPCLSHQAVFIHDKKVKTKSSISWEQKEHLRWNKKHCLSFLKGFQLLQKTNSDLTVRF